MENEFNKYSLELLFGKLDLDKDGYLDKKDIKKGFKAAGYELDDEDLDKMVSCCGGDGEKVGIEAFVSLLNDGDASDATPGK